MMLVLSPIGHVEEGDRAQGTHLVPEGVKCHSNRGWFGREGDNVLETGGPMTCDDVGMTLIEYLRQAIPRNQGSIGLYWTSG